MTTLKLNTYLPCTLLLLTAIASSTIHADILITPKTLTPHQPQSPISRTEYNQLKNEIARLRTQQEQTWLNQHRAQEIKNLIHQVLADAQTRSSLLASPAAAGHDGSNFYIASADGAFLLQLTGHFQLRYIYNHRDTGGTPTQDDDMAGFNLRRAKFYAKGHVGNPKIKYELTLAADSDSQTQDGYFSDYLITYQFAPDWAITAGRFKQAFARENLVSSSRQMAVDRGNLLRFFAVDRSQGIMFTYTPPQSNLRWNVAFNNGRTAEFHDWNPPTNTVDFAFTSRLELLLAGSWKQFKDFSAWSKDKTGLLLGAAIHYQEGETGGRSIAPSFLLSTVDLSYENNGLGIFLAGYSAHMEGNEGHHVATDFDDYGTQLTLAYFVIPDQTELFARLQYARLDSERAIPDHDIEILTVGLNWYHRKHHAKFTLDYTYAFDHLPAVFGNSASIGLADDVASQSGQHAIRAQYQIKW